MKQALYLILVLALYPKVVAADQMTVVVQTDDVVRQEAENKFLLVQKQQLEKALKEAQAQIVELKLDLACTQEKLKAAEEEVHALPIYKKADVDRQKAELETRLDHIEVTLLAENTALKKQLAEAAKLSTPFPK